MTEQIPQSNRLLKLIEFIEKNKKLLGTKKSLGSVGHHLEDRAPPKSLVPAVFEPLECNCAGDLRLLKGSLGKLIESYSERLIRFGTTKEIDKKNLSFLHSILYWLDTNFRLKQQKESQIIGIEQLHTKVLGDLISLDLYKKYGLDKSIDRNELANSFRCYVVNNQILDLIANYFYINIFVIDSDANEIRVTNQDMFDTNRNNIILVKVKDMYEPVLFFNEGNDEPIKSSNDFITFLIEHLESQDSLTHIKKDAKTWIGYLKMMLPSDLITPIIAKKNDEDDDVESEKKPTPPKKDYVTSKYSLAVLQEIADFLEVSLVEINNGKKKKKTKNILVRDINEACSDNDKAKITKINEIIQKGEVKQMRANEKSGKTYKNAKFKHKK